MAALNNKKRNKLLIIKAVYFPNFPTVMLVSKGIFVQSCW